MRVAEDLRNRHNILSPRRAGRDRVTRILMNPKVKGLLLYASMSWVLFACRATPLPTPPPPAEPPPAMHKAEPPAPAAAPEAAVKPPKQVIARHLPESRIARPEKDSAPHRVAYNTLLNVRPAEAKREGSWRYRVTRQGQIVGFEFSNHGGNRILPPRRDAVKNQLYTRDFQFRFDERARQDIHLLISDWAPSRDRVFRLSELTHTLLLFFPRTVLPAIVNSDHRNIVTLPTGEEVEFAAATHEISGGVFSEAPVDLQPDRAARKFPAVEYQGKGVVLRANARGADPRIGTTAVITTGTPAPDCADGIACRVCEVPAKELWEQSGAVRFKFATDADFDRFLIGRCGFGLPRIGADFALVASPANP